MSKEVNFQGRSVIVSAIIEDNTLTRVVINDGGLEFPFTSVEKSGDFLVAEYGGTIEEAIKLISEACGLEGVDTNSPPKPIKPQTKKTRAPKAPKAQKAPKEPKPKKEKAPKAEPVKMVFNVGGKEIEKTVLSKTILPGQTPESTEDVVLDEFTLHIDIYSKKNRTSKLFETDTGVVAIANVSLKDAIYKYAELKNLTFGQADKFIKIKRGLIAAPVKTSKKESNSEKDSKPAKKE